MYKSGMLIYNGNAGQKEVKKTLSQIIGPITLAIPSLLLLKTEKPGDAERFCRQHGEQMDIVIVMGGDGTVHECVNGLAALETRPVVSILPAGTCNDFARALGLPLNSKQAAELIAADSIERAVDIVKSNDRYFDNFWGTGLIAEASQNIDEQTKGTFGKLSYYVSAIKSLSDQDRFTFTLKMEDQKSEKEAVMILILNGGFIGTTEFPVSTIEIDDGLLDVLIVREAGFVLLKEILTAKTTMTWEENQTSIEHFQTASLTIELSSPRLVDLDGEHYKGKIHKIELLRKHLRVLVPNITADEAEKTN
ncbi:diacylglycerol/lipid kinase family protein [Jeotgalibacillus soli]|uniref:DAGKc domain-containing protein n=1 Tax=Jeotgalibacillus soli TaxID=889306 RepID=A0A0C2W6H7_9BACL|nr:diacylglycerol kinase family protein [Jeotgalibacillus soli]KIL52181.1 hypothetical protein KP78_05510 [Jeotgalibacillus soli]